MAIADKLVTIAENEQRVYEAGYEKGKAEGDNYNAGYLEGKEAGKQEQDIAFWNLYQRSGRRDNYDGAFYGDGWNNDTFKPKYNMKPSRAMNMFCISSISGDVVKMCEELGITMDFSTCQYFTSFSDNSFYITRFGVFDLKRMVSGYEVTFRHCRSLVTIDEIICYENTPLRTDMFYGCSALANVKFSGTITKSGMDLSQAPALTKESLISFFECLKDYSEIGGTYTVKLGATNIAKLTNEEKAIATDKGWTLTQ